ncbi:hypothetical protein [Actinomycetospora sp. NBRC 106378]|uniref:hypothetical protein n=1 Tax=Actinomycetospora sp. NBRC 106378 TaxID=3032208 RepID=UPI0024A31301|nr:hypothetical protein [Actinomycetospora sp. NBRC 106378]GLZ50700.1 hypothetical protein Acsp07_03170 [Actinomycetospora sp. NBRC 106378]
MTGPDEPEDTPTRSEEHSSSEYPSSEYPSSEYPSSEYPSSGGPEEGHPSSGSPGEWSTSPADPPTEPGWARSEVPPTPSAGSSAEPPGQPRPAAEPAGQPTGQPRSSWWRSRRVRVGAAGTLAALVLLGGGFGAGYAVADASAPPAAHVAAAKGHARKGAQGVRRKRQQQEQQGQVQPGQATIPG